MSYIYTAKQCNELRRRIRKYMQFNGVSITSFSDNSVGYSLKPFLEGMVKRLSPRSIERVEQFLSRKTVAQRLAEMTTKEVNDILMKQGAYYRDIL